MANFNIPVTATVKEVAAAQWHLGKENARTAELNADRVEQGLELLPLFDGPLDYITDMNQKLIASWQHSHEQAQKQEMRALWDDADDAERAAAREALGG